MKNRMIMALATVCLSLILVTPSLSYIGQPTSTVVTTSGHQHGGV